MTNRNCMCGHPEVCHYTVHVRCLGKMAGMKCAPACHEACLGDSPGSCACQAYLVPFRRSTPADPEVKP